MRAKGVMSVVLLAAMLWVRIARAQSVCPSIAQADAAEAQGMAANQSGDHEGALHRFEQSYALCHGVRAQGRMAIALMALGRWGEADRWMRSALAVTSDPWVSSNRAGLEQQQSLIDQHVGELLVTGEGGTGNVLVDGRPLATFPMSEPVHVTAGSVVVRVDASGHHAVERTERVDVGRLTRVAVTLVPLGATATPDGAGTDNGRGLRRALAWTSVGLSAVGLGVGIWASSVRINRRGDYDDQCPAGYPSTRLNECNALLETASESAIVAPQVAGFVAAGVFAATAAVLFATMPEAASAPRAFACGPGPGMFGIGCEGRF